MTDNNTISPIERIVMRRIQTMRALRILFSNTSLAIIISGIALAGIGREVWVAHVLQNAPHNPLALPQFYLAAFDHTRFIVQVLSLITVAAFLTLARETARLLSSLFVPSHA